MIFGYVVMFVVSFITLTATYLTLGQDRTFQTGSYEVTALWLLFNAVFALAAAVIAGKGLQSDCRQRIGSCTLWLYPYLSSVWRSPCQCCLAPKALHPNRRGGQLASDGEWKGAEMVCPALTIAQCRRRDHRGKAEKEVEVW